MSKVEDGIALQEIVYKPGSKETSVVALKSETRHKNGNLFLYLVAGIANILAFSAGVGVTWPTPILPILTGKYVDPDNNPFGRSITPAESAWIAALLPLGASVGPLAAGKISDKIGRKRLLLILGTIQIASFVIKLFSKTVPLYYIARFLIGISTGSVYTVLSMYLTEIAENHNRGAFACSLSIFSSIGMNFSLIVGPYLSIRNFILVCLLPLLIFLASFTILGPESPIFLASINDEKRLSSVLATLRSADPEQLQQELTNITESAQKNSASRGQIKDLFISRPIRKGMIICLGLLALQQLSGVGAILMFTPTIFKSAGGSLTPEICTMIIGTFQVIGTSFASIIVDRAGRKILLLLSSLGTCVTLASLGLYFYLKDNHFEVEWISWLPVLSLVMFILVFSIGLGPVPWAVMAELFPPNVRATGASLISFFCFLISFAVTVTFPPLSLMLGMARCFWIFSLICLAGTLFIYWILPETKGKNIQEIQLLLGGH